MSVVVGEYRFTQVDESTWRADELAARTAIHEAIAAGYLDAGSIPRHLLAGTEPPGLSCGYVVAPEAITRGDFVRVPPNEPTRLDARTALTIGTRVRVDDKASSMHDREGVVQAYGPGGEVEVVLDGWPGAHGFHRAQLALVDDTLPECDACNGTGQVALFSSLAECHACGGSGGVVIRVGDRVRWVAPDEYAQRLIAQGFPTSGESVVHEIKPSSVPGHEGTMIARIDIPGHSISGQGWVALSWCTLADVPAVPVPVPRTPDRACRYCHGTGAVLLVFSHVPCECVGGST